MTDSYHAFGFVRVGAITPELRVADVEYNVQAILAAIQKAAEQGCRIIALPELCITGYSCADLFYQRLLLDRAQHALLAIAEATAHYEVAAIVGVPIPVQGRLYNCAAFLANGKILGLTPKTYLPTTNEFYEERWFTSGRHLTAKTVEILGQEVPIGTDILFQVCELPNCLIGIEICEDLWAISPPSGDMALAGATVFVNPSASTETLGKAEYRRDLVRQQSARCLAGYIYACSGPGESTTDVVYPGHSMIAENGVLLAEAERFRFETQIIMADLDIERLIHDRWRNSSFSSGLPQHPYRIIPFHIPAKPPSQSGPLLRAISQTPFVPADQTQRAKHCREIFNIQATGLAKRLKHTQASKVTIGLSGGLDSTLALLVAIRAFDLLGLDHQGVIAVTMPGFGTTSRTRANAEKLANLLGVTLRCIPIGEAVRQHFRDIGHREEAYDTTFENAQARERTQILMDIANQVGGLNVGTGDLSELALGWCTYNADQMSMYHVNAGIPKTLVRYLIAWCAESEFTPPVSEVLMDIIATPITPELLPLGENEVLQQKTEAVIGPYILHDFFLYHVVRYQFSPRKVFFLARQAFEGSFSPQEILTWLAVFYTRFFSQQFKRSAMPDGPKVGSVALSPRGDWRMPSDASVSLWLHEIEALKNEYLLPR